MTKKLKNSFAVCLLLAWVIAFPVPAFSDSPAFSFGNDFFAPGGRDRYLTNTFGFSARLDESSSIGIANEMYSPDNLRTPEPPEGDHPYSGYTYLSYQTSKPVSIDETRLFEARIGLLGHASGTGNLQDFIHTDLNMGVTPEGWDSENPSEVALDFIYGHKSRTHLSSWFGDTTAEQTYGFRIGNVVDELFLDQRVEKKFFDRLTGFVGVEGHLKAFDTHLEGRMFHSNGYTVDKEYFVAAARVGTEVDICDYSVGFMYILQTPTFRDQTDSHLYASLYITKDW